jgi:hypothetical protein
MVPYLKWIHLTLDSWRAGRDNQCWKLSRALMEQLRRYGDPEGFMEAESENASSYIRPVPLLGP